MKKLIRFLGLGGLVAAGGICAATESRASSSPVTVGCTIHTIDLDLVGGNLVLECSNAPNNIGYMVFVVANNPTMGSMLTTELTTQAHECADHGISSGFCSFNVTYDNNTADNPPGCGGSNCRALLGISGL